MDQLSIYIFLFFIIAIIKFFLHKLLIPTPLILVISGILISLIPGFPRVDLNSKVVLDIFLPLLIYRISVFSSWREVKKDIRPIALLSIGHVIFITVLIAVVIHALFPELGWPLAFVLGSVISPPDDVAIVSIAEKIRMPRRIVNILKGEGMFNDAAALILFRFSLAATITHEFIFKDAVYSFFAVLVGETIYGLILGYFIGRIRLLINESGPHMIISLITPFLAYLPAERLGGCGVLATVVTGLVIEQKFLDKFLPEIRLIAQSVWNTLGFAFESILFLLVGLEFRFISEQGSSFSISDLVTYALAVIGTVIIGRFIWVFANTYIPRYVSKSVREKNPYPSWQSVFVISWAGMRGGISLAAALAVPDLPFIAGDLNPSNLLVLLVFCVIVATLVLQGLALPMVLKLLGVHTRGQEEKYLEHVSELKARKSMASAVLRFLSEYKKQVITNQKLCDEIKFHAIKYKALKENLVASIKEHDQPAEDASFHDEMIEFQEAVYLSSKTVEIERETLLRLWRKDKINHTTKNKLLRELDYRAKHINE